MTKDIQRLGLYPGHTESGCMIGWLSGFLGLKKPFHHYLSLSVNLYLPPQPFSLCTYLHFSISQVNKSLWVFLRLPGKALSSDTAERCQGIMLTCQLPHFHIHSTLCLVAKEVNASSIILRSLVFMEGQVTWPPNWLTPLNKSKAALQEGKQKNLWDFNLMYFDSNLILMSQKKKFLE